MHFDGLGPLVFARRRAWKLRCSRGGARATLLVGRPFVRDPFALNSLLLKQTLRRCPGVVFCGSIPVAGAPRFTPHMMGVAD